MDNFLDYMKTLFKKKLLADIGIIHWKARKTTKLRSPKWEYKRRNKKKSWIWKNPDQKFWIMPLLWDLQSRPVKALNTPLKCQRLMKDQNL